MLYSFLSTDESAEFNEATLYTNVSTNYDILIIYYDIIHVVYFTRCGRVLKSKLNVCLINSIFGSYFSWPFLHWDIYIDNHLICSHS